MMTADSIPRLINQVDPTEMSKNLFHLSKDPLPYRKLCYTIPGHARNTLYEADDFITSRLESWGYDVEKEACRVQSYRRDASKPIRSQFAHPEPDDPWYTAFNLYAKKRGEICPGEIIVFISH